jgi:alpha-L-fucosidase
MFSDAGPDVRWIGNEKGVAGETCWSTIDPTSVPYAGYDAPNVGELLQRGDRDGSVWRPGETDVSIRPGWFWHPSEDTKVRSGDDVMSLYFSSVGRNSKLLLNVPPTRDGLLHDADVRSLDGFAERRRGMLAQDYARGARVAARGSSPRSLVDGDPDTFWSAPRGAGEATIDITLPKAATCNVLRLQEPIRRGQVIESWRLECELNGASREIARGTTIGCTRLARFEKLRASRWRLALFSSLGELRLATVALHLDDA